MFSTQLYGPILAILSQLTSLFHLGTVTKRMRMLLTTPAMEGNEQDVHTYDIELKNVTFAYAKEDVIKDVSLKIPSGSITALVGPVRQRKKYHLQADCPLLGCSEGLNYYRWRKYKKHRA